MAQDQGQDWNAPGSGTPGYQEQQPAMPGHPQSYPQGGAAPVPAFGTAGMAVPAGMYYDAESGLTLPNGTELASHGRRIGAYFLAALLWIVTLFIGYAIWGLITWKDGRTPVQQILGMRCWKPQEMANASWGIMLVRGLCMWLLDGIALGGLVSFVLFLVGRERRTLYDMISTVVVLHDPNRVLDQ